MVLSPQAVVGGGLYEYGAASSYAVIAATRGDLFAADSLEDWLRAVPLSHSWCQPRLNWSAFTREPPLLPWVAFKVGACHALLREPLLKTLELASGEIFEH